MAAKKGKSKDGKAKKQERVKTRREADPLVDS